MPPEALEPTISAGEQPQIYASDRAALGRTPRPLGTNIFLNTLFLMYRANFRQSKRRSGNWKTGGKIAYFMQCILAFTSVEE